jgi:hypothetical protein
MFAAVVGMVAPTGKYRKFVSLVMGFILLLLMVQPLAGIFSGDEVPVTEWFVGGDFYAGENFSDAFYADWWDEYLGGAFEAQLEAQVERLLNANNFTVHSAEFSYSENFDKVTSVRVRVSYGVENLYASERVPFIRIVPPEISPIRIGETSTDCPHTSSVKTLISEFYNLPTAHILVEVGSTPER